jgi:uncharacterized protein YjiS (DUF1127 family)
MPVQALFVLSVAFGFIASAVVTAHYIWPQLRDRPRIPLRIGDFGWGFRVVPVSGLTPHRAKPQTRWRPDMNDNGPVLPIAGATVVRAFLAVLSFVTWGLKGFGRARRHRREAAALAGLDCHMLADIGISRADPASPPS